MSNSQTDESGIQRYVTTGEGSVARCFVKDVLGLKDAKIGGDGADWGIWWLGTVPCRKVQIVGLVVGVMEYERRMMYTIDDGTEVVDCAYALPQIKTSPVKPPQNLKLYIASKAKEATATIRYGSPPPIKVGKTACVVGKVEAWNGTKQLFVDTIEAKSPNDELKHWAEVAELHRTKYAKPFTIPKIFPPSTPARQRHLKNGVPSVPGTRSSSIAPSTPSHSSPVKDTPLAGPSRLRHPTKISSSQLTTHTFRAHLVQYLDHASRVQSPTTPVRRPRSFQEDDPFYFDTPVQKRRGTRAVSPDQTPRAKEKGKDKALMEEGDPALMGFSLSQLRRVPELDCLGRRVVRAETKRRAKEQRLKEKEVRQKEKEKERVRRSQGVLQPSQGSLRSPSKAGSAAPKKFSSERTSLKVKRLFQMTLRILREDGAIIVVEGPGKKWDKDGEERSRRLCWRELTNTSMDISSATAASVFNTTTASTASSLMDDSSICMDMDEDPPSDPDPTYEEECYLPVTAFVLAPPVLQFMGSIVPAGGGMKGVTVEEILGRMRRDDGRWSRLLGEHIKETIGHLVDDEKVWQVGKDKWGLVV
ncbi:hypothetical protein M407DRAFT_31217 [Tulasnella calospora MUT 4182]|uniref:CST complex subunit STN1 n=1 Tax=Tulasnella calospora MUT 4182 TaxID=1051891 RepID=A0A0C3Q6W0_9AGAM|nr:hypothetical protein M407DRAFT_31217 [Tulasnella calospora MUT 4182]